MGPRVLTGILFFPLFSAAQSVSLDLTTIATNVTPQSLVVGDFNHDGKPDLAVTGSENAVSIMFGNGDGTFRFGQTISVSAYATRIATADFNHDGNADLAVSVGSNGQVMILLGNADGTFRTPFDSGARTPNGGAAAVTPPVLVGDVNGDGNNDLILGPYTLSLGSSIFSVLLGKSDGTFQSPVVSTTPGTDSAVAAAFLGDGKTEIVIGQQSPYLLAGAADGSLSVYEQLPNSDLPDNPYEFPHPYHGYHLTAGDANGNGHTDLVAVLVTDISYRERTSTFRAYTYRDGTAAYTRSTPDLPNQTVVDTPYIHTLLADMTGDGKADLLLEDPYGNLFVLTGQGDGSFVGGSGETFYIGSSLSSTSNAGDFYGSMTTADFRGTGRQDVILVLAGKSVVLLKNGSGPPPTISTTTSSATLTAAPAVAGSLTTIFGSQLAYATGSTRGESPFELNGASCRVGGYPASFSWVSPTQLNLQIPWEVAGLSQANLICARNGVVSQALALPLAPATPGIFTMNGQGTGQAAALIGASSSIAAPTGAFPASRPVNHGEYVSAFGTGLGAVKEPVPVTDGLPPNYGAYVGEYYFPVIANTTVTVGGVPAVVQFSGLAPGLVGVYQINIQIPADAPSGSAVPVVIRVGGVSAPTVTIAIGPS